MQKHQNLLQNSQAKQATRTILGKALNASGPYAYLAAIYLIALPILMLSRLGLIVWQSEQFDPHTIWITLLQGLRVDFILIGLVAIIPLLLLPLFALVRAWNLWQKLTYAWLILSTVLITLLELITPSFILEYGTRPNYLLVEYLKYPKEISSMLLKGFKVEILFVLITTAFAAFLITRLANAWQTNLSALPRKRFYLAYPLVLLLMIVSVRSSFGHRPANPAMFAITDNTIVNTLVLNSSYAVAYAVYNLKQDQHNSHIYGDIDKAKMLSAFTQERQKLHDTRPLLNDPNHPTLIQQKASEQRSKPLNIVIILEESLGARFVASLGGKPLTPNLEQLKTEGWWFNSLYATGTRSVRGIEAVIAGFPPTPAQSVVKRSLAQSNFTTIASLLQKKGYHTQFIYGGEAHFDNMRGFFLGNGFKQVIERKDWEKPNYVGSWGVSDEDLLTRTHQEIQKLHDKGKPFFTLAFSSSNHAPFEFPDDRIALYDKNKATENNAVKYADFALGRFFDQAKHSDYYQDTLFLVVADHDVRVRGKDLIPVNYFHIPALILGADIHPRLIRTIASQIDLAPTLLSLAGLDTVSPMLGRDISQEPDNLPGRAMMQYNDNFGWLEGSELTVLRPQKPAAFAHYDFNKQQLHTLETPPDAQQRVALALGHSLLAEWLYEDQLYQTP